MSEQPEVIEGEIAEEEIVKTRLTDRIGKKTKIALGVVGTVLASAIAGSFIKEQIYGSVTDAFGDVLDGLSSDDEDDEEDESEDEIEETESE